MRRVLIAGAAALAIAGPSLAYAQQAGRSDGGRHWQPSAEDMRAFGEARLAALKAGLTLTPDQAKNWPAFEQAARDLAKQRIDRRMAMRNASPSNDAVERLRRRAAAMSETGAALKKLSDAAEPLYKSLDDNQKRRFAMLNRVTGGPRHHFRGREYDGSSRSVGRREGRLEGSSEQRL
jgi:zinc resistance-associated protein